MRSFSKGDAVPGAAGDDSVAPPTSVLRNPRVRRLSDRKRILLVDDDPGVRGSLGEVLAGEGYAVLPAADGEQALRLSISVAIDLVLLDLNLPVKNGWDTFERLSREQPLLPVVIMTARPNQLFTAVGAGVAALLEKPLDIPTLLRTIPRLLAEPVEARLLRLAGRSVNFSYHAGRMEAPGEVPGD